MSKYIARLKSRSNGVKRGIGLTFGVKSRKVEKKKTLQPKVVKVYIALVVFLKTFKRTVTITFELNIDDLAMQSSLTS